MISKIIDKGKTRLSLHRESKDHERHHLFTLPGNLPAHVANNHIIGYKDDEVDNYVEPPTIGPTETEPRPINSSTARTYDTPRNQSRESMAKSLSNESQHKDACATNYTPFYPEHLPSTPPKTPSGSFLAGNGLSSGFNNLSISQNESQIDTAITENIESGERGVTRPKVQLSLKDFCVERTLGTGSFGRVHLIQSKVNHRYYALKVLQKAEIVQLKQVEHTNNERNILIALQHPFIVNLWGSFQDDCNLYMVMDFIQGGELFSILRKSKKFSNDIARFYAGEVLLALAYLHNNDIIYRDLKPENLLLDAHGHIKITDFGFAKKVPDITWTMCGTPDYLAPEIIQTKGYGKAADYWALGVLIFEMLAGYPPFYDDNQFKLYEKILTTQPKYPSCIDSTAKDLLKHLLTTDLTQRYGNLKRGYHDIADHKWFESLDFNKLLQKKIRPPFIPRLKGMGDASSFDKYPENYLPYGTHQKDPYRDQFPDF